MPTVYLGKDAKLYYGTAGDPLGSLSELTNVRDVNVNLEQATADVTTRANSGWRATAGTLREGTLEFEMLWDPADAGYTAIKDAYVNGTTIELAALTLDKATSGAEGPKASWTITNFSRSEALEEGILVSVTAQVETWDQWVEV